MGEGALPPLPTASPFVPQPPAPGAPPGPAPVQGQPVGPPPMMYQQPPPVVIAAPPTVVSAGGYAGYRTLPPKVLPQPGQVIIGWEGKLLDLQHAFVNTINSRSTAPHAVSDAEVGCCMCETLSLAGWLIIILLAILFWPACFIVCMIGDCHDRVQRPVYGWPGAATYPSYAGAPPPPGGAPPPYFGAPPPGQGPYQQPAAPAPPPAAAP